MNGINVHIYPSPFTNESRRLKITASLAKAGIFDSICCIAFWEEGLDERETLDDTRQVWRLRHGNWRPQSGLLSKVFGLVQWMWRIILVLRNEEIVCLNCHHVVLLPLCVFLKWTHKCALIYDAHELETERAGLVGVRKMLAKRLERLFVRYVDQTVVVSESIAVWYRNTYGLNAVHVVRNVPYNKQIAHGDRLLLKKRFSIPDRHLLFIYQGAIGEGRGIRLLLNAFARLDPDKHVIFMGYGEQVDLVREYAERYPNIHFTPAVPPDRVQAYTAGADVGLSLIEDICLSYHFCLPNKLFEYILCGLPVVVSDLPEMVRIIDEHQCGWKVAATEDNVVELIQKMSPADVWNKAEYARACCHEFGWDKEEKVLLKMYRELFPERDSVGMAPG